MNIQSIKEITSTAVAAGYDMITVEPWGGQTLVTCVRRESNKEPWTNEIDENFETVEFTALEQLAAAGLDARATTNGIRAFGRQESQRLTLTRRTNGNQRPANSVATTFQPFSWRREDYNKPVEEPKRPEWYPCY